MTGIMPVPLYRFARTPVQVRDVDASPPELDWSRVQLEVPDAIRGGVAKVAMVDFAQSEAGQFLRTTGVGLCKFEYERLFDFRSGTQPAGKVIRTSKKTPARSSPPYADTADMVRAR